MRHLSLYGASPLLAAAAMSLAAAASRAEDISIVSPKHDETIQDNDGTVTVTVQARLREGQYILLVVDGSPVSGPSFETTYTLNDIDRGEHKMEAVLVDDEDRIIATSQTITFYVWRASSQFPVAKPRPKPPPKPEPKPEPKRATMTPPKR